MRAIVYESYGSPDVLRCEEIEKPAPGDREVLIEVRAASVNPLDWHYMRGTPYLFRLMAGVGKPKITRLGVDVAGRVEAVGREVKRFKPGDDVFGTGRGAFAEYVCAPEQTLTIKPSGVTFEHAACVPVAGVTALQALRDTGCLQARQTVLINGAAGGVGTFAVQIAKAFGADVTGVCSTRNVEMVRAIGADRAIDYTQEDFTSGGQRYDVVLDCIGNHTLLECRRALKPKGICVMVGGSSGGKWLGPLARPLEGLLLSIVVSQKLTMMLARVNKESLAALRELMEVKKVVPVVDRRYKLGEVPEAIRYMEEGHARGKVVITPSGMPVT